MSDLYCDICGRAPVRAQILVEGAKMLACASCMRSGKVIQRFEVEGPASPSVSGAPAVIEASEELVEGYGRKITNARERAKLPLSVVAERIREKESYLNAIEHERFMPTIEVARKLERELGIKLVEKVSATVSPDSGAGKRFTEPTLADMLADSKKGKGK
ncbi:MAG: multiprotein-bridging factor 1 family protein [Candidatus Micrarchaeia archaeon]